MTNNNFIAKTWRYYFYLLTFYVCTYTRKETEIKQRKPILQLESAGRSVFKHNYETCLNYKTIYSESVMVIYIFVILITKLCFDFKNYFLFKHLLLGDYY